MNRRQTLRKDAGRSDTPIVVPIDGKTARGSYTDAEKSNAIHIVSAWATDHGITLGQVAVDSKSNEITAVPQLLDMMDLKGTIVTLDAMGRQKAIAKKVIDGGGDYLFEVIMRRHDVRSTMMTSNRPLEEWGKLIGDVPSATAILDRYLHHSDVMQITGRRYRMGNQLKSSNSTKAPTGSATEEA